MKIYTASKVRHAHLWLELRRQGYRVTSTWIDEAVEGQTASHRELAERCLREVSKSDAVLLYCEAEDILGGALMEAGAALVLGKPVVCVCVGESESISRVFKAHPRWRSASSIEQALALLGARPRRGFLGRLRAAFRTNDAQVRGVTLFTAGNLIAMLRAQGPLPPWIWVLGVALWPLVALVANLVDPLPARVEE